MRSQVPPKVLFKMMLHIDEGFCCALDILALIGKKIATDYRESDKYQSEVFTAYPNTPEALTNVYNPTPSTLIKYAKSSEY
jgi:hypothetical protein